MERKNRMIRPLGPDDVEEYLTIYLMSYPAFKDIGDEGELTSAAWYSIQWLMTKTFILWDCLRTTR